jgi:outer membrane immunogenic protein
MKRVLLSTVSVVALMAAEPTFGAPRAAPPAFSWTGCYVGAHVGGGWGRKSLTDTPAGGLVALGRPLSIQANPSGFIGGGQVGCNYQFAPMWVAGIEGDVSAAGISGDVITPFTSPNTVWTAKTDWLASVTARFGYAWNNNWLLYAKGGAAWAHDKYTAVYTTTWTGEETRSGWTVGAGLEWAFMNNWSAKLEYDFYGFGSRDVNISVSGTGFPENIKQQIHAVKFGINYRFDWIH